MGRGASTTDKSESLSEEGEFEMRPVKKPGMGVPLRHSIIKQLSLKE